MVSPRRGLISIRFIVPLALASLALALAPSQANAAPRGFFGVVPQDFLKPVDYARLGGADVGSLRIGIHWPALQRTRAEGNEIRDIFDDEFGNAAARGIQVLPFVNNTPDWVNPREKMPPIDTAADRDAFKNVLRLLVERYGPGGAYWRGDFRQDYPRSTPKPVTTWQIWNEPSSPSSWHPKPNAADYAKLVLIAEKAIHEADPTAKIMLAGVYHDPRNGGPKAPEFTRKVLSAPGLKSAIDSLALHPYGKDPADVGDLIGSVRKVIKQKNAAKKELFITESGWSSGKGKGQSFTSIKGQARKLKGVFRLALQKRRAWNLGGVYWYSLVDLRPNQPACFFCHETGLFDAKRRPKPAWEAFKSFTAR